MREFEDVDNFGDHVLAFFDAAFDSQYYSTNDRLLAIGAGILFTANIVYNTARLALERVVNNIGNARRNAVVGAIVGGNLLQPLGGIGTVIGAIIGGFSKMNLRPGLLFPYLVSVLAVVANCDSLIDSAFEVKGTVIDADEMPVAGATVNISLGEKAKQLTVSTNQQGRFVVAAGFSGITDYDINIEKTGYYPFNRKIPNTNNSKRTLFTLSSLRSGVCSVELNGENYCAPTTKDWCEKVLAEKLPSLSVVFDESGDCDSNTNCLFGESLCE